jgi:hypothetical protein
MASIIDIFCRVQLFSLGIIGEYMVLMHFRSMAKPAYVIRSDASNIGNLNSWFGQILTRYEKCSKLSAWQKISV